MMRTVKDFVRLMFKEKKSPEHIRAVATCSVWHGKTDEVERWIEKGKKIIKKRKEKRK